eukprot:jgi/Tetstr1/453546/TSEL_040514.t1
MADEAMAEDSTAAVAGSAAANSSARADKIMAMQLDPRYCKGNLFQQMFVTHEKARELMKEYDDKSLLPAPVDSSRHVQTKRAAAEAELRTFRYCNMLPKKTEDPLKWRKKHASSSHLPHI